MTALAAPGRPRWSAGVEPELTLRKVSLENFWEDEGKMMF